MERYRATAHVGPFEQGDVVDFDESNPEHAGLIRTGWFELVAVFAPVPPLDLSGYTGPVNEEYRQLFAQPDVTVTPPWNLGGRPAETRAEVTPDAVTAENPDRVGSDVGASRRRESRRALRRGNDPAGADPGKSAVPEGHVQPGE